jgi:hypothetical protein
MLKDIDTIVYAFSDGSAIGNPGPGGYGAVLKYGENVKEFSQGFVRTTNNRMEMLGAITALDALKGHQRVVRTKPWLNSFTFSPYLRTAPYPPGPGFPIADPSEKA